VGLFGNSVARSSQPQIDIITKLKSEHVIAIALLCITLCAPFVLVFGKSVGQGSP